MADLQEYDTLTGASLPAYATETAAPPGPFTGDSGYAYGDKIFDLLKTGVTSLGKVGEAKYKLESKDRFEIGRQGLTQTGQPAPAASVAGVPVSMNMLVVLGLVAAAAVLLYVARR